MGSGLSGAGGEIGLAGVLVLKRDQAGAGHAEGVLPGGEREGGIPGERRQVRGEAAAVGEIEEQAFGLGGGGLG